MPERFGVREQAASGGERHKRGSWCQVRAQHAELGLAFDILVASILFGVFFFHLRDSFGSLNVGQFNRLSEANQPMPLRDAAAEPAPGEHS